MLKAKATHPKKGATMVQSGKEILHFIELNVMLSKIKLSGNRLDPFLIFLILD